MKKMIAILAALVLSLGLAGCGGGDEPKEEGKDVKIGISLPTQREERWVLDKENFEKTGKDMGIEYAIQIADNDAAKQQTQCENLISQGVDVLIVAPHNEEAAKNIVEMAHESDIPVISYDRLIGNADVDLYVTFDQFKIGNLMGTYINDNVDKGNLVILRGDAGDSTTVTLYEGAMAAIQDKVDDGTYKIVADQVCVDWAPAAAQKHMEQALTANDNNIQGVIAQNDGTAGGAIQALAAVKLAGKVPVTGQDCEVDAIKRIKEGTQSMTVFFDVRDMAKAAFEAAVKMANGETVETDGKTVDNGKIKVPSLELDATMITKDNWKLPIEAGYMSEDDLK